MYSQVQSRKFMCLAYIITYTNHSQVVVLVYFSAQYCTEYSSAVVQSLSRVRVFVTPRFAGFFVLHHLPQFTQTHVMSVGWMMLSNHLILCCGLLLLPSIFPSIRVFSNESALPIFLMSQLFPSGSQSIGTSASASVVPMNTQGRFPLGLTGLISFQSKGLLRVFSSTTAGKPKLYSTQPFYGPTLTSIYDYRIKI